MDRVLHYEIAEKLGEGKNGAAWSAVDTGLQRAVVVKELNRPDTARAEWRDDFRLLMERFNNLDDIRIARFYSLEESEGRRYLVREYVEGQTAGDLARTAPVDYHRWLSIALELARIVKLIHDSGLFHGNITSSNILTDPKGGLKLVDAGLTAAEPQRLTAEQSVFLAPELFKGGDNSPQSELFALGAVLYHLLTGQLPRTPVATSFERFSELEVPGLARLLLGRLLASTPEERFGSADELIMTLQGMMSLGVEPVETGEAKKWSPTPRQWLMISILVLLLIILWLVITSNPRP